MANLPVEVGGNGVGMLAKYFKNPDLSGEPALTRYEAPSVSIAAGQDPVAGFSTSGWKGTLESPVEGTHVLQVVTLSNDGVRVFVDEKTLVDKWTGTSTVDNVDVVFAIGSLKQIRIEFIDISSTAKLEFNWQIPGTSTFRAVPRSAMNITPLTSPEATPTDSPVPAPTEAPMPSPTESPVQASTDPPLPIPTKAPEYSPTNQTVPAPRKAPESSPTDQPVAAPTKAPESSPTDHPVPSPTEAPVPTPTEPPTASPTNSPVSAPIGPPVPTPAPTLSAEEKADKCRKTYIDAVCTANGYRNRNLQQVHQEYLIEEHSNCMHVDFEMFLAIEGVHFAGLATPALNSSSSCPNVVFHSAKSSDGSVSKHTMIASNEDVAIFSADSKHHLGNRPLPQIVQAYQAAPVGKDGAKFYDAITNNCVSLLRNMANPLGVELNDEMIQFVSRKLLSTSDNHLWDGISESSSLGLLLQSAGDRMLRGVSKEDMLAKLIKLYL